MFSFADFTAQKKEENLLTEYDGQKLHRQKHNVLSAAQNEFSKEVKRLGKDGLV